MIEYSLIPHPNFPSVAVTAIKVSVERPFDDALSLTYRAEGALTNVLIPDEVAPGFEDGLWRHSCFEAFLGRRGDRAYSEFNFSPSGSYAAYDFDQYRDGMRRATKPEISWVAVSQNTACTWSERVWLVQGLSLSGETDWQVGLTAVIEALDGTKSYWALAHAPGPPDFHNPDCFIATLPAPDAS